MIFLITMTSGKEYEWESYDTYDEIDAMLLTKQLLIIDETRIKTEFIESIEVNNG